MLSLYTGGGKSSEIQEDFPMGINSNNTYTGNIILLFVVISLLVILIGTIIYFVVRKNKVTKESIIHDLEEDD